MWFGERSFKVFFQNKDMSRFEDKGQLLEYNTELAINDSWSMKISDIYYPKCEFEHASLRDEPWRRILDECKLCYI